MMYLAMGVALGGVVGANWSKIKPLLVPLLGPAAEGFHEASGDLVEKFATQVDAFKDARAEQTAAAAATASRAEPVPPVRKKRRRGRRRVRGVLPESMPN